MLVDITIIDNPIGNMIAELNKNMNHEIKIEKGIYELGHFNLEYSINDKTESYPELDNFNCYGVCDNYKQILEQCPELTQSKRNFVISITKIEKKNQSDWGGWRWHKWGPYIGTQEPTCEYLYNEPVIEMVYCYHIYELIQ